MNMSRVATEEEGCIQKRDCVPWGFWGRESWGEGKAELCVRVK